MWIRSPACKRTLAFIMTSSRFWRIGGPLRQAFCSWMLWTQRENQRLQKLLREVVGRILRTEGVADRCAMATLSAAAGGRLTPRELEIRLQICVHWSTATNGRPRNGWKCEICSVGKLHRGEKPREAGPKAREGQAERRCSPFP